jgi:type I restriction enzyme S subunit
MKKMKLQDCCIFISDGDHQAPPKSDKGVPFITISNITTDNRIDFSNVMYVPLEYYEQLSEKSKAIKNDILYSVVGSFGKPVLIEEDRKFVFQRHIAILRPNLEKVIPEFLYYTLLNPQFYTVADYLAIGAAQRTISLESLRNIEIELPSLSQQKRIVDVIAPIDKKIHENAMINDYLQRQIQLLYDYWFTQFNFPGDDGRPYKATNGLMVWNEKINQIIPADWQVKPLGAICSFRNGINYDKNVEGNTVYKIINVRNISSSTLFLDESNFDMICLPQQQGDKYRVSNDSIIIARSGIPGTTRILYNPSSNIIFCGFIICCTPYDNTLQNYLTLYLRQFEGSSATQTGGSILKNVSQETLKNLLVPIPQQSLLSKFNDSVSRIYNLINGNIKENVQLTTLRDWLLPMLMNGQAIIED